MSYPFSQTRRIALQGISALAASLALPSVRAQADFPRGPIRIVIPLPAGGAADVGVRAMAIELEKSFKQTVVVENKPGGLYQIGLQAVLQAPADGLTLLHLNSGMVAVQVVQKRYDLNKQLAPLTMSGDTPMVLMVGAASPHKTVKDLAAFGRANPGKLTYATPGPGSIEHLKCTQLGKAGGFEGLNIAYKGGPDMVKAVIGGEVDFTIAPAIFAAQFAPKGLVRVLATIDNVRLKEFPDVPSINEAGIDITPLRLWGGYAVHADTPPAIVARLHKELAAATTAASVVERLTPFGMHIMASRSPDEFRKLIASDAAWMTEAARGLKLDTN